MSKNIKIPNEEELKQLEKIKSLLYDLFDKNSDLKTYLWISVFIDIMINSANKEKITYGEFFESTVALFESYRGDWK
jgi:hypothetical protein